MNKPLGKVKKAMDNEQVYQILENNVYGTLATFGDDYPYCIPVNYYYHDQVVYIHCANKGHKIDNLKQNAHVCMNFVKEDTLKVVDAELSMEFDSVVLFGSARFLSDEQEKSNALLGIIEKYCPSMMVDEQGNPIEITANQIKGTTIIAVDISDLKGKTSKF